MDLAQPILEGIIVLAKQYDIQKVILFGSRARGDNWERSDIDLAVCGGDVTRFSLDVDEDCWLEALRDRNNVAHSYNEEIANNIIKDSKEKYIAMFEGLQREIEKNWL